MKKKIADWVRDLFAALLFLLCGLGMLSLAWIEATQQQTFLQNSISGEGIIVDFVKEDYQEQDENGRKRRVTIYTPMVEFTDNNERAFRFTSRYGSSSLDYHKGERVSIIYDPENPNNAEIKAVANNKLVWIMVGGMGTVFSLVGVWLFVFCFSDKPILDRW